MSDTHATRELYIPTYGMLSIYPNGSRDEADEQRIETSGTANIGPNDWVSFSFGAFADVSDDTIKEFAHSLHGFENIREIRLGASDHITDRGLKYLAQFEKLEEFSVASLDNTTARGWQVFGKLRNLRKLDLQSMPSIDDSTAKILAGLANLVELNLNLCPNLTDVAAHELSRLEKLEYLGLNMANLTDNGIKGLTQLKRLKSLDLTTLRLTSRLTNQSIEYLSELQNLENISMPKCSGILWRMILRRGFSRSAVRKLERTNPNLNIWTS